MDVIYTRQVRRIKKERKKYRNTEKENHNCRKCTTTKERMKVVVLQENCGISGRGIFLIYFRYFFRMGCLEDHTQQMCKWYWKFNVHLKAKNINKTRHKYVFIPRVHFFTTFPLQPFTYNRTLFLFRKTARFPVNVIFLKL